MRRAAVNKASARQQVSTIASHPAPTGGWNAIDALADMKPSEAVSLDNWYPRPGYCEIRGGSVSYATGMSGTGKTLAVYSSLTGIDKQFCSTEVGVYDVTSAGAVGASVAARTNGKHQHVQFGDGTNNYLIMCNGVDKPLYFDGTTWLAVDGGTSPALTGLTTTTLISVCVFKGRLIFLQNSSLKFWYLAAGAAGGALTAFDISGVAQKGGYLMAVGTWTVDSGYGPDDRLVLVTSNGEVIVYQGTNPASSTAWGLVGVYQLGRPLGRQCMVKIGSDLILLTRDGAFPLSTILIDAGVNYSKSATRKIETVFTSSALSYGANFGWKITPFPEQSAVIVNVPVAENGTHYQYVMNTINSSWCRFIGWDAEDFSVLGGELYYCQGTSVIKAWTGVSDQGGNIDAYAKTAFSDFGKPGIKDFKMFRPMLSTNGSLSFQVDLDIDYADAGIYGSLNYSVSSGGLWDSATWDSGLWSTGDQVVSDWASPSVWDGYTAAGKIKISTKLISVQWLSTDYIFEVGSGL